MPAWLISWIVFCVVGLAFPALLLLLAWRHHTASEPLIAACFINNGGATRSLSRFCSDVSPTLGTHP